MAWIGWMVLLLVGCGGAKDEGPSTPDAATGNDAATPDAGDLHDAERPSLPDASVRDAAGSDGSDGADECVPGVTNLGSVSPGFEVPFDLLSAGGAVWTVVSEGLRGPVDLVRMRLDGTITHRERLAETDVGRFALEEVGDLVVAIWERVEEGSVVVRRFSLEGDAVDTEPRAFERDGRELLGRPLVRPGTGEVWLWTVVLGATRRHVLRPLHDLDAESLSWLISDELSAEQRSLVLTADAALFLTRRTALGIFASPHPIPPTRTGLDQPRISAIWGFTGEPASAEDRVVLPMFESLPPGSTSTGDDSFSGLVLVDSEARVLAELVVEEERDPNQKIHHSGVWIEGEEIRLFWASWQPGPRHARTVLRESRHALSDGALREIVDHGELDQDLERYEVTVGPDVRLVSGWEVDVVGIGPHLVIAHSVFSAADRADLLIERRCSVGE